MALKYRYAIVYNHKPLNIQIFFFRRLCGKAFTVGMENGGVAVGDLCDYLKIGNKYECMYERKAPQAQNYVNTFGHAATRPDDELIKNFLLPTPPRTWHRRT